MILQMVLICHLQYKKNLTLDELEYEDVGKTSVKQNYSWGKSQRYKKTIQYFDMLFGFLYNYIEKNYKDDEIVISLFADHGQGYLVPMINIFCQRREPRLHLCFVEAMWMKKCQMKLFQRLITCL